MTQKRVQRWGIGVPLLILILLPLASVLYKVVALDYRLDDVLPDTEYRVAVNMSLDGNLGRVNARTFLPLDSPHQAIRDFAHVSDARLRFAEEDQGADRIGVWYGGEVPDGTVFSYSYSARLTGQHYVIDPAIEVPDSYPDAMREYLVPEPDIQVDSPEIQDKLQEIGADSGSALERLERIFDYTAGLNGRPFKGTTDALTTLRLGEASCNGKSRLFVALARASGLPARLIGGIILSPGRYRTSHQWVEVYLGGHWVPFCPTNDHFARLPAHYIVMYHGDQALFRHTADINFDWEFDVSTRQVPSERSLQVFQSFNVWAMFDRLGFPFSLLRTVLMLPVGAMVVVILRNVVGVPTFGTFLPALIAAAAGETGLGWGLVAISVVMLTVAAARLFLQRFGLLHSPTLAILLAIVVFTMLGTSLVAERLDFEGLTRITFFPIAVMAIASERFYLSLVEQGPKDAFKQLSGTLIVVLCCFLVMNSLAMQVLVSGFPEILLWVIAADLYLGRWVGMRVLEIVRFRRLLTNQAA